MTNSTRTVTSIKNQLKAELKAKEQRAHIERSVLMSASHWTLVSTENLPTSIG